MHNEKETIRVVYCAPGRTSRITEIGSGLVDLQRAVGGGLIEPFYPFEEIPIVGFSSSVFSYRS